jgi:hypothetical protein
VLLIMNVCDHSGEGAVEEEEEGAGEPQHQQGVEYQQANVVVLLPCLLQEHEAVRHYHADQDPPRADGPDHRALQEVDAEQAGHSEQEQPLPQVVQSLLGLLRALHQSQCLEDVVGLGNRIATINM